MFRKLLTVLTAPALTTLFFTATQASAQWGPGQQGPGWDRDSGYTSSSSPAYESPMAIPATAQSSESFFNGPEQSNRNVLIQLRVPASARIWFDDKATTQTGMSRQFISPALPLDESYAYRIRVQWTED